MYLSIPIIATGILVVCMYVFIRCSFVFESYKNKELTADMWKNSVQWRLLKLKCSHTKHTQTAIPVWGMYGVWVLNVNLVKLVLIWNYLFGGSLYGSIVKVVEI